VSRIDPLQFIDILDGALSVDELSGLSRQFSVAYEALPGATKRDKTREFLGYMRRNGRMAGLAEAIVAMRPDLTEPIARLFEGKDEELVWLDQIAPSEGESTGSSLTWRWPSASASRPLAQSSPTEARQSDPAPPPKPNRPDSSSEPASTSAPPNPYTPGVKIADEAMFFGRAGERDQLRRRLAGGAHVAIVGGRGLGGSSLLLHVARSLLDDDHLLPAYVDMKDAGHHTLAGLLNSTWSQWWARVKPGNAVVVRNLAEFVTAVRKLNGAGFKPLLLLDEFEQVIWRPAVFPAGLFDAWHELGREGQLGFAVTGHSSPADVMGQGGSSSRFYELFQQLDLGLLDTAAARDLLAVPASHAGFNLPDGAVDHLLALAGLHPFYLQLAGYYFYDALARNDYSRAGVAKLFETAATPYWQELWDSLSPLAQAHYPKAKIGDTEGIAARQMRILGNRGLVAVDDSGFRPFSEGFAGWLKRYQAATEAAAAAVAGSMPV
jgi:hypothetical protein